MELGENNCTAIDIKFTFKLLRIVIHVGAIDVYIYTYELKLERVGAVHMRKISQAVLKI